MYSKKSYSLHKARNDDTLLRENPEGAKSFIRGEILYRILLGIHGDPSTGRERVSHAKGRKIRPGIDLR